MAPSSEPRRITRAAQQANIFKVIHLSLHGWMNDLNLRSSIVNRNLAICLTMAIIVYIKVYPRSDGISKSISLFKKKNLNQLYFLDVAGIHNSIHFEVLMYCSALSLYTSSKKVTVVRDLFPVICTCFPFIFTNFEVLTLEIQLIFYK